MPEIVFAASTLSTADPTTGFLITLVEGEVWAADDPLVVLRPDFFTDSPPKIRRTAPAVAPIEAATKAPGERRNVKR